MPQKFSTLSFDLHVEDEEFIDDSTPAAHPRKYRSVEARPRVDGVPLTKAYVFDTRAVLGYGARSGETDLFTCSCGVAGCAGIFDCVSIDVSDQAVGWTFPKEPFRGALSPALFAPDAALTVCFERAHYEAALETLKAELLSLASDGGLPVILAPESFPDFDTSMADTLEAATQWATRCLEREARRHALFGPLLGVDVDVGFPDGLRGAVSVESLAYTVAFDVAEARDLDADEVLEAEVAPAFRTGEAAVLAALRALSWDSAATLCTLFYPDDDDKEPPADAELALSWPRAVLHFTPTPAVGAAS